MAGRSRAIASTGATASTCPSRSQDGPPLRPPLRHLRGPDRVQANQGKLPEFDESQHADPCRVSFPWYWVPAEDALVRLDSRWEKQWLLGWRDVCRNTDTENCHREPNPLYGVGHKFPIMIRTQLFADQVALPLRKSEHLSSWTMPHGRKSVVLHLLLHIKQFPVLPPKAYQHPANGHVATVVMRWLLRASSS